MEEGEGRQAPALAQDDNGGGPRSDIHYRTKAHERLSMWVPEDERADLSGERGHFAQLVAVNILKDRVRDLKRVEPRGSC